jgi:periplasmic divalent cation tolerance protein
MVVTTFPTRHHADEAAADLIDQRLAACAQIVGPVTATYRWQGKIETSMEWSCTLKTRRDRYDDLEAALRKLHPYDVPQIVAYPMVEADARYLRWIDESLDGE